MQAPYGPSIPKNSPSLYQYSWERVLSECCETCSTPAGSSQKEQSYLRRAWIFLEKIYEEYFYFTKLRARGTSTLVYFFRHAWTKPTIADPYLFSAANCITVNFELTNIFVRVDIENSSTIACSVLSRSVKQSQCQNLLKCSRILTTAQSRFDVGESTHRKVHK